MTAIIQKRLGGVAVLVAMLTGGPVLGGVFLVKDGLPRAEVVIDEAAPASVRLAASELQEYLRKISGATLPIRTTGEAPDPDLPQQILLGASSETARLGLSAEGLEWGAYRIKGEGHVLVLMGGDTVFEPRGILARNRGHWATEGEAEWDAHTGSFWQNPVASRHFTTYDDDLGMSAHDETGTLNAVYSLLGRLGVRWYMPGALGEIVPQTASIALPEMDVMILPDYDVRMFSFGRFGMRHADEDRLWLLRLGVNKPFGYGAHHGLAWITRRQEMRDRHPEMFALYNHQRQLDTRTANACLSSPELFAQNLRFVRTMFDMYDVPVVSVWPDDGFGSMCQCDLCKGKDTPERGPQGLLSDYVWDYVNRIAMEVEKTHPDKFISSGAYSTYLLPPENMDRLNSNILVYIVNSRRRFGIGEEDRQRKQETARRYKELTGNKVINFMNHGGGANSPRIFANDIRDYRDMATGEDIWVSTSRGTLHNPGFNHLNVYIAARYQWDADQDIDALLAEYYERFYGPAAERMAAFIDHFEAEQRNMRSINSAPVLKSAMDLFKAVKDAVDPASVYGQRVAMFEKGLQHRWRFYEQIKDGRVDVPVFALSRDEAAMAEIEIDGKLDEPFWRELPGRLMLVQSGEAPVYETKFKIGVKGNHLYVGMLCRDEPGRALRAQQHDPDDGAIWYGENVEILLETPLHSYYQITINPKGATANLDRGEDLKSNWFEWDSQADVATHVNVAEGYWSVEARIPFTPSTQDPLHEVIGPAPSADQPWFFNICRQRVGDVEGDLETTAFVPTGRRGFHNILTFGELK